MNEPKLSYRNRRDPSADAAITSRASVTPDIWNDLEPQIRARAFTVAAVEDLVTIEKCKAAISQAVAGKIEWKTAATNISDMAAYPRAHQFVANEIMKTFSAARYKEMQQPEELELFPYWQYKATGDGRTRSSHQALDGLTLPANDPFWRTHFPPWDWGCRCRVLQVSKAEAERLRNEKWPMFYESSDKVPVAIAGKQERISTWSYQPGDIRTKISDMLPNSIHVQELYRRLKNKTVMKNGAQIPAWDFACEPDIIDDSEEMRKAGGCVEHGFIRIYDTNTRGAMIHGTADRLEVTIPAVDDFSLNHLHPRDTDKLSSHDIAILVKPNCKWMGIVTGSKILRFRFSGEKARKKMQHIYNRHIETEINAEYTRMIKSGSIVMEVINE